MCVQLIGAHLAVVSLSQQLGWEGWAESAHPLDGAIALQLYDYYCKMPDFFEFL